jgi:hypothetical protein
MSRPVLVFVSSKLGINRRFAMRDCEVSRRVPPKPKNPKMTGEGISEAHSLSTWIIDVHFTARSIGLPGEQSDAHRWQIREVPWLKM